MPNDVILRRWPGAITLLIRHPHAFRRMSNGTFHTISKICAAHEIDEARFVRELAVAIATSSNSGEQEDVAAAQG